MRQKTTPLQLVYPLSMDNCTKMVYPNCLTVLIHVLSSSAKNTRNSGYDFGIFWDGSSPIPMLYVVTSQDPSVSISSLHMPTKTVSSRYVHIFHVSAKVGKLLSYPLVNVYITMENHHFSWEKSL
jgi:hypothetical protein